MSNPFKDISKPFELKKRKKKFPRYKAYCRLKKNDIKSYVKQFKETDNLKFNP